MRTLTVRRSPAPIALAAILLVAFILLFAWPQPASAHDSLVSSDPAADSTIETLPSELTLTFSAALIGGEGATEIVVTDADGNNVADGKPTLDGAMLTQSLASDAASGEYHVIWKVVSSDGHPTSGEFGFTVSTGTEATPSAAPTAATTPTTEASATPDTTTTPAPEADSPSAASAWIWTLSIGGIAVIGVLTVWFIVRAQKNGTPTDSDDDASHSDEPAER